MIEPSDVIPHLLKACPDFEATWRDHLSYWGDDTRGLYIDVSPFVHYLVDGYANGNTQCFTAVFAAIERLIVEGTEEVQGVAIVGILESIQNVASYRSISAPVFMPWLGTHSRVAWLRLILDWEGDT